MNFWQSGQGVVLAFLVLINLGFYFAYERTRPSSGELILVADLCAFCIALRSIFSFVPYFNPVMAIICLSGIALGSLRGFLIGSLSALLSNFIFGQGPWTLYQMTSWGIFGAIFGFVRHFRFGRNKTFQKNKAVNFGILDYCVFCILSFLVIIFITGPIVDLSSVFMFGIDNVKSLFVMLAGGFVFNLALALSTVVTILFFSKPFLSALNRVIFRLNVNSLFHSQF